MFLQGPRLQNSAERDMDNAADSPQESLFKALSFEKIHLSQNFVNHLKLQ